MTTASRASVPKLCRHKATGRAVVRLDGRDRYCGVYGSSAARAEYDRLIALWLAHDRRLPEDKLGGDLTIEEILAAYLDHAEAYYRATDGDATSELACIKLAIGPLRRHYGETLADDFGPRALIALRDALCRETTRFGKPPARNTVNGYVRRVKAVFRWAVTQELVPPSVYEGLRAVAGLRAGRSAARETPPVRPVTREQVDAALPHLSRQVERIDVGVPAGVAQDGPHGTRAGRAARAAGSGGADAVPQCGSDRGPLLAAGGRRGAPRCPP